MRDQETAVDQTSLQVKGGQLLVLQGVVEGGTCFEIWLDLAVMACFAQDKTWFRHRKGAWVRCYLGLHARCQL